MGNLCLPFDLTCKDIVVTGDLLARGCLGVPLRLLGRRPTEDGHELVFGSSVLCSDARSSLAQAVEPSNGAILLHCTWFETRYRKH